LTRWQDRFTASWADDLAQEAAIEAWRRRDTLRRPEKWSSFVRTIARRRRSRAVMVESRLPLRSLDSEIEQVDQLPAPSRPPERVAVGGRQVPLSWCLDELDALLPRLGALNERIVRSYYEGFSCSELAERYRLPEESVKVRLYRSRRRIRREFEGRVGQVGRDAAWPLLDAENGGAA
jgi:RNA polymerase sigma factor (sigma-70 family)